MAVAGTDLVMVERGGVPYKTTAGEVAATAPTWMGLVARPSAEVGSATVSGVAGAVREHTKVGDADIYRFVPDPYDPELDGFYSTYTAGTLSGLIVTRG